MRRPLSLSPVRSTLSSGPTLPLRMRIRTLFRSKFLKEISTRTYDVQSYTRSCSLTSLSSAFNSSSRCCMVSFLASENVSCYRSRNQIPKRGFQMEPESLGCGITRLHVSYALDNDSRNVPRLSAINLCHALSVKFASFVNVWSSSPCRFVILSVFLWIHLVTFPYYFNF